MATEDQDILDKIAQLAGQINRHKNGQQPDRQTPFNEPSRTKTYPSIDSFNYNKRIANPYEGYPPSRGAYRGRGYPRGGRALQVHRNRTLVLNGNGSSESNNIEGAEGSSKPAISGSTWVTKTDRHMQLINKTISEKHFETRAKAMNETRMQKLKQRDDREKNKINRHLQYMADNARLQGQLPVSAQTYEVNVQGISFRVTNGGSKLVKVSGEDSPTTNIHLYLGHDDLYQCLPRSGDGNAAKSTPKTALVGGVRFHRSTNGNLVRDGIIKAHRRNGVIKKINEPCRIFATTGSCSKGPQCRYIHDPTKVAVCREFLLKGSCPSGDSCDLSHELTPQRTPACLHFAKGNCSNSTCRYVHVKVAPAALVCRNFGIYGYCEKGAGCQERHVHECPDFSNTGICTTKGCRSLHREKASVMRSKTSKHEDGDDSDISSDDEEDEEIDSEDVDSDDLEDFFGDGDTDLDFPSQQDYVQLK